MSRNQKNNHYHYAEKFENKRKPRFKRTTPLMPFKAVIASLVVLMIFGFVSTTFGAYVFENEPAPTPEQGGIISTVRNIKSTRDVAVTGANADLAGTSGNVTGGTVVVEVPSGWTSYSHVQFALYQNGYAWCSADMTRIANTNFYYGSNPNHTSWANEQIMFFANNSHYGEGSFDPATNSAVYSGKITRSMSSNYYTFWLSGSANAYTNTYKGNYDSLANAIYVYDQTANIYTSTTGSAASNYTSSGTGGNVTITARYLDTTNNSAAETTTPSSNGATSVTYERAVYHTAVTYTATANTGYRFVGWYTSTTATSAASTNATYQRTSSLTGTNTLYARFIKRVTVTAKKSPSGYSGTAPKVNNATSATVDVGDSVSLNANVTTGITAVWKSGSASGTTVLNTASGNYTPTATVTLYACYTLTSPTFTSYSYSSPILAGGTSTLSKNVSSATGSNTGLVYTYSAEVYDGTVADSSTWSFDSSGNFIPTVPGKYKITVSVYDTAKGLTSSTVSKNTEIVTVKPAAPDPATLKYQIDGWTDDYTQGTTGVSYSTPIKVPINSETFTITAWLNTTLEGYSYNWSNVTGNYNTSNGAITAISGATTKTVSNNYRCIDSCTDTDTALLVGSDGHYAYQINVKASYNGVESNATQLVLYYDVISDFLDIQWMSFTENSNEWQKIYAEDNDITQIKSEIRAGGTTFNTALDFSKDNITYTPVEVWTALGSFMNSYGTYSPKPNDSDHQTSALHKTFDVTTIMGHLGAKWIRVYMNDTGNNKTASATRVIHTTVGTRSTVANRPIYYYDNTGSTYVNSRVMAFFIRSSDDEPTVRYQTAQALKDVHNNTYYRFYIPEDATQITFAHVSTNNYVLPTYTNGTFSYAVYTNNQVLMAWSEIVDLSDSANYGKTTYKATAATTDGNGIKNYTGSMTTFGG